MQTYIPLFRKVDLNTLRRPCRWHYLFILLLLQALAGCQSEPKGKMGEAPIAVALQRVSGERGTVLWTVKNKSARYLVYDRVSTPWSATPYSNFDVETIDGSEIPYKGIAVDIFRRTEGSFQIVAPMAESSVKVNIVKIYMRPHGIPFKVRSSTFLAYGFYASEADAKSAIGKMVANPNRDLPFFKDCDSEWVTLRP